VWSAGPAHFFRVGLSGFRILEPGCGRVALDPYQAPFDYRIKLPLPQGALHVAWLGEELTVDGPDNVEIERASSLLGTGL